MAKSPEHLTPKQLTTIERIAMVEAAVAGLVGITSLVIITSTGALLPTAIFVGLTAYLGKRATQNFEKSNFLNPKSLEYRPDMYSTPGNIWSPYHRRGYNIEKYLHFLPLDDL